MSDHTCPTCRGEGIGGCGHPKYEHNNCGPCPVCGGSGLDPAVTLAAAATLPGAVEDWRCLHGHAICKNVTPQLLAKGEASAAHHSKCGPVLVVPLPVIEEDTDV